MFKQLLYILFLLLGIGGIHAQNPATHTSADRLRGGIRPERTHFDVLKYDLTVDLAIAERHLTGKNKISFRVLHPLQRIQLDLFKNMQIDSIVYQGKKLTYQRDENAVFIDFPSLLDKGKEEQIDFYYSGNPLVANNPPWDGGFIFTKDKNGKDWVSVAVQGTGASLWYPNKDTQRDKPEEAEIHVIIPQGLMNVSNGRLTQKTELPNGKVKWSWKVVNPITNYNLVLNIGDYVHFSDTYKDLDLDFYVLPYHLEKAKTHFKEAKLMHSCFAEKFGEYPFKEDGYKLIETPYLGMEHQSAVGYGNGYTHGYLGQDRSGTGIGLKWDFIIIHESAHEWFGNSITSADLADMWIHESFTTYAEAVYIECRWGKEEAVAYLNGTRKTVVRHDAPIIGDYGVNKSGSGDMYSKGANMLHTLRSIVHDDEKWWAILKAFHQTFKHRVINSQDVIQFFSAEMQMNLHSFFIQYLNFVNLPELIFQEENGKISYKWKADISNFEMPVDLYLAGVKKRIYPTTEWQILEATDLNSIQVDLENFYINFTKK